MVLVWRLAVEVGRCEWRRRTLKEGRVEGRKEERKEGERRKEVKEVTMLRDKEGRDCGRKRGRAASFQLVQQ